MLVLTRKIGETIMVGDDIKITVHRISGNQVGIAIEAPRDVPIKRGELLRRDADRLGAATCIVEQEND